MYSSHKTRVLWTETWIVSISDPNLKACPVGLPLSNSSKIQFIL